MTQHIHGFAVIRDRAILINTVSDTPEHAKVNYLVHHSKVGVNNSWSMEDIDKAWDRVSPGVAEIIGVTVERD